MTAEQRLIYTLQDCLQEGSILRRNYSNIDNLQNNLFFNAYIKVQKINNETLVPLYIKKSIDDVLRADSIHNDNFDEYYIHLNQSKYDDYSLRSSSAIFNRLVERMFGNGLGKVTNITTGEVYYGGRGLILTSNFTPLFITTVNNDFKYVAFINPVIFQNTDNLSKYIRTKIIIGLNHQTLIQFANNSIEVRITQEINNFIVTPTISQVEDLDNDIRNFLKDNSDILKNHLNWTQV